MEPETPLEQLLRCQRLTWEHFSKLWGLMDECVWLHVGGLSVGVSGLSLGVLHVNLNLWDMHRMINELSANFSRTSLSSPLQSPEAKFHPT